MLHMVSFLRSVRTSQFGVRVPNHAYFPSEPDCRGLSTRVANLRNGPPTDSRPPESAVGETSARPGLRSRQNSSAPI